MSETIVEIRQDDGTVEKFKFVEHRKLRNGDWTLLLDREGLDPKMVLCETNFGLEGPAFKKIVEADEADENEDADEPDEQDPKRSPSLGVWGIVLFGLMLTALIILFVESQKLNSLEKKMGLTTSALENLERSHTDLSAAFIATHRGEGPVQYFDGQTTRTVSWR